MHLCFKHSVLLVSNLYSMIMIRFQTFYQLIYHSYREATGTVPHNLLERGVPSNRVGERSTPSLFPPSNTLDENQSSVSEGDKCFCC